MAKTASNLGTFGNECQEDFTVCYAHGTLAVGDIVWVTGGQYGDTTAAVASFAAPGAVLGVVKQTAAVGDYIRVQTRGFTDANCEGTTDIAAGDFLKCANATDYFVKDGTRSVNSSAVATEAYTTNAEGLSGIFLLGCTAVIA